MTPALEQTLAKVIEAQANGGFTKFAGADIITLTFDGRVNLTYNIGSAVYGILEVLLDRQGLIAAYGTATTEYRDDNNGPYMQCPHWKGAAIGILDGWLSGGAEKAIETAYNLLPAQ